MNFSFSLLLILSSALAADSMFSKTYEGCGSTKKEALYTLSGNIQSRISTHVEQTVIDMGNDNVKSKISDYTSSTTNLSLVNIEYKKKQEEICAVVHKDDQVQNTKKLLAQALLYDVKNLPTDIDAKIETLSTWLANIKQLSYLIPVFMQNKDKEQLQLNKEEKVFTDIYTKSIAYSDSLFFKSCNKTKKDAKIALNKKLFMQKEKKKGFFDSITSIFDSDKASTKMLDNFDAQLIEVKQGANICLMLKKAEILDITQKMYADIMRINEKSLPKNPKKRYKEIQDNLYEQLKVTKALLKLFPKKYKSYNFEQLDAKQKLLANILEKTYPQYVIFHVSGGENIQIRLDEKQYKNNIKYYIKNGEHTYKITAKGKCSFIATFDNNLFDDITIDKDLSSLSYPTVVFQTDKNPSITLNGQVLQANITNSIAKCNGKARYIATFAHQTLSGEVDTVAGENDTVLLHFLTQEELSIFNDAKSKKFTTVSGERFSESLTPLNSENLKFSLERDPMHGKVTIDESGSFEYVSQKGYTGNDNFGYTIETPEKTSAIKLVNLLVIHSKIVQVKEIKKIVAPVAMKLPKKVKEAKKKLEKVKKELKKKVTPVVVKTQPKEAGKSLEQRVSYNEFKMYVESKELTKDFLQKVQKKFPNYFERLRQEMINQ